MHMKRLGCICNTSSGTACILIHEGKKREMILVFIWTCTLDEEAMYSDLLLKTVCNIQ